MSIPEARRGQVRPPVRPLPSGQRRSLLTTGFALKRAIPWRWVVVYAATVAYVLSPRGYELPAALVGFAAFGLVPRFLPECRFDLEVPLSPANVGRALFAMQLILIPLLLAFYGITFAQLPHLPSLTTINVCMLLTTLAYASYSLSFALFRRRSQSAVQSRTGPSPSSAEENTPIISSLMLVYAAMGIVGFGLLFGSVSGFLNYVESPASAQQALYSTQHATLSAAAGTFLRPFLIWAFVISWCLWMDRTKATASWQMRFFITLLVIFFTVMFDFSYNRTAIVTRLLAMVAAYSIGIRRVPVRALLAPGALLIFVLLIFGQYRSSHLHLNDLVNPQQVSQLVPNGTSVADFTELYMNGPQFAGYLLEGTNAGSHLYYGQTLFSSLLFPVPVVGQSFRPTSGVDIYNSLIYNTSAAGDQVVPVTGELFINFSVIGVAAGFALIGFFAAQLQKRFEAAGTMLEAYAWFTVATWVLALIFGSISVTSQEFVYFFWPLGMYLLVKRLKVGSRSHRRRGVLRGVVRA